MFIETKPRTVAKGVTWRICAIVNSYLALLLFPSYGNLEKALIMNISGFMIFYLFERLWNQIYWGKKYAKVSEEIYDI